MEFTHGKPAAQILSELDHLRSLDPPTHGGRVLSYVYDPGVEQLDELMGMAAQAFLPVNGLDPTTFQSVAVLEREVIAFTQHITNATDDVVGSVTSGGTESCLLAVKSAREEWRTHHPNAPEAPVMIAPSTVHPAFHKACEYFDLKLISVEVDPDTGSVDPTRMIGAVDEQIASGSRPALVVLSAPNYPLGVLDDIATIAPAMAEREVGVHVDACVGGFVLPFWPDPLPAWDFRVEGVRSISLDVHKYGYAPKGASVVLYRDREAYHHQFFACVSWPGYPVVNPTILGSRSVTALAASWAVISHLGTEGYRDAVKRIHNATVSLTDVINQIDGMRIVGNPFGPLLALGADDSCAQPVDPFRLVDELKNHGFLAQAQPGHGILPRSAHLTLTPVSADLMDELSTALKTAADAVRGLGPAQPRMELLHSVLESGLPQEQAEIMATLEGLPAQVARPALIDLLGSIANPKSPQ